MIEPDPSTIHAPRLLFLHGGGTNAEVFYLQCRVVRRMLEPHFRCVFADAPFFSSAHPQILPVYADMGPYRRWLRYMKTQPEVEDQVIISEIDYQMRTAMENDDRSGATGEWVGLVGFSQGAKMAASILYESQLRFEETKGVALKDSNGEESLGGIEGFAGGHWKFAVCMNGRPPLVSLRETDNLKPCVLVRSGDITEFTDMAGDSNDIRLKIPTVHVHGLKDEGLEIHRVLLKNYCEPSSTSLVEWDGNHRIPIKSTDVTPIVDEILRVAKKVGVVKSDAPIELFGM